MPHRLIDVRHLNSDYTVKSAPFHAVRDVSFTINTGETVGLVGESGCGKTTIAKLLLGLQPLTSGEIWFDGKRIDQGNRRTWREVRRECQMIFQDPYGAVDPRMTIEEIIREPLQIYRLGTSKEQKERIHELISLVGLEPSFITRYPHELSGGQKQRVVIARALAPNPRFLICDEAIASLDVSIQAQIINLLKKLQEELKLTYLFISHDLAVVKYLASRTLVMYAGQIVEAANGEDLYRNPQHPYTKALLSSIPIPDPKLEKKRKRILLTGEPPSSFQELHGCPFASRCPQKMDVCHHTVPSCQQLNSSHLVSCHLYPVSSLPKDFNRQQENSVVNFAAMKKLLLAKPRGFCAGVDRAIDTVKQALKLWGPPIWVKHHIVHNMHVVQELERMGARFIEDLKEVPKGERIIYSAHGVSPAVRAEAKERNLIEIDATCGLVTRVHSAVKRYAAKGCQIILIGHKNHVEIIGTAGEAPDVTHIVESVEDVFSLSFTQDDPLFYVTQTTLSLDDVKEITDALIKRYPHIKTLPSTSICYATTNRQMALRDITEEAECILVIGDPSSSNSNRLREVGERRKIPSYLINSEDEIDPKWIENISCIGMSAGASTPENVVQQCIARLQQLGVQEIEEVMYTEEEVLFQLPKMS